MSARAAEPAGFSELCKTALDSSIALWPLFVIRAVFMFCNCIFFALALLACCFPLVVYLFKHLDGLDGTNLKGFFQQADFTSFFTNGYNWLALISLGMLFVAVVWLFFAFYDSSVYSQLYWHQKKARSFSWEQFLADGVSFTAPMMGLQFLCVFSFFSYLLAGAIVTVIGIAICQFLPWWMGVLLAFPASLIFGMVGLVLFTGMGLAGVYLIEGNGIIQSFSCGLRNALANKGRAVVLFFLVLIIYVVFYAAFNAVFSIFGLLPFIGILFKGFLLLVNSAVAIGLNIYMDSLCAAIRLDSQEID
jgi:hypothetical protein